MRYRSSRVFSLGGWTPQFHTMLACIVLLRILAITLKLLRLRDSHPLRLNFPAIRLQASATLASPTTPDTVASGLGYSAFARHYSQNLLFSSSYLDVSVRTVPLPLIAA